jgi:uncharacterized protein
MGRSDSSGIRQGIRFLLVTFGITYTTWIFLALAPHIKFGTPLFMVLYITGGFGPTISAIVLIALDREGRKEYLARLFNWKLNPLLYILAIGIVGAMGFLLVTLHGNVQYAFLDWYMVFPLFLMMIIGGGLEELGWRGVMQELSNRNKLNPLFSSLVIGVIWALWHLPLFYIPGVSQYQGNFMMFFVGVMGLSLMLTVLYSVSNSIWLCVAFHSLINTSYAMGFDVKQGDASGLIIRNGIPVAIGALMMIAYLIARKRNTGSAPA